MSNNITYSINSLSQEEVKTILEALLYSSSVDVYSSWYDDNLLQMVELTKKIRKMFPDLVLENVFAYSIDESVKDIHTDELLKYFPELTKNASEIIEK